MELEDLKNLLIGYTAWKWKTEYDEKQQKKRSKDRKPAKQKSKKRSKR